MLLFVVREGGSERLGRLPEATQLGNGCANIQTQSSTAQFPVPPATPNLEAWAPDDLPVRVKLGPPETQVGSGRAQACLPVAREAVWV